MRSFVIAAAFATVPCIDVAASEPVKVILYGPSQEISGRLDALPRPITYREVTYTVPGSKHGRKLLVGVSGGIESSEVLPLLYAVRLHEWAFDKSTTWRLYVHGAGEYARITVKDSCLSPTMWALKKDHGVWTAFDGPGTPEYPLIGPCELVIPPPSDPVPVTHH